MMRTKSHTHSHIKPHDKLGILVVLAGSIIWGIYPSASRAAYADGANVTFVLILTTLIRTLMLFAFCRATGKSLFASKADAKAALIGGFWQGLSVTGVISALSYIQGPLVLTILFSATLMLLFFMAWRQEIKIDVLTVLSTILVFAGMNLVVDVWHVQPGSNWIGIGIAFAASCATTGRIYVYGRQMKTRNPAIVGAECFIVATAMVLLTGLWVFPVPPATLIGWGWTALSALSLGLGTFGMFYGIALLGSFKWSLFAKIEPIFTSLFSVLFLGEYLKLSQYVGIAVVVGSLVVYQLLSQRKSLVEKIS